VSPGPDPIAARHVDDRERRARLGLRHRLAPGAPVDDPVEITESLVALHATDPATVHLSAMVRMANPAWGALDRALYDDHALVRHHAMRRTLWVQTPAAARVAHAACTVDIAAVELRKMEQLVAATGLADDPADWVAQRRAELLAVLAEHGSLSARQVGALAPHLAVKLRLPDETVSQSAHTRLLVLLGFEGSVVRGRPTGGWTTSEYTWSATSSWLPDGMAGPAPAVAARELVERYLHAFGPATTADVQWWAGWTVARTKRALADAGAVPVTTEAGAAWLHPDDTDAVETSGSWAALLPALDPTTMGWKGRQVFLGGHGAFAGPLFDRNGNAGPTVWVEGRVVGGWGQRPDGDVALELLEPVTAAERRHIDAAADVWRELLGGASVRPRFPTPLQQRLAAANA
jgi:hypothetical protein